MRNVIENIFKQKILYILLEKIYICMDQHNAKLSILLVAIYFIYWSTHFLNAFVLTIIRNEGLQTLGISCPAITCSFGMMGVNFS